METILFDSRKAEYKTPFGVLTPGETCVLHMRIPRSFPTERVSLVLETESGAPAGECTFFWTTDEDSYALYRCEFSLPQCGLYFYWFRVTGGADSFPLFKLGGGTAVGRGEKWQLSVIPKDFTVPEEFQGGILYHIFPDRFCRDGVCDLTGKLEPYVFRQDWGGQPEYRPDQNGEVLCNDFFGGNFKGITKKLPYIRSLGTKIIYLNPISYAYSNHRYDTADYKRPDPMLGTEEDFQQMCQAAHALGMRVILDGVYSHTGSNSVYFDAKGIFGHGACSGESSPYYTWYTFRHFPDDYECWWNFKTLPNVNELAPAYMRYVIDDEDSVVAHWLKLGADGFRLDVVDELPDGFVLRMKQRLRQLNPNAFLLGEVWEDASNKVAYGIRRRYFVDGELDSVMNYPWKEAIIAYAKGWDDGSALGESIMTLAENYPPQVLQCVMNPLSTHDTARILTVLAGEFEGDREYLSHVRLTWEQRKLAKRRLKLASFLQFTLPGCPSIYYGDEAGMEGCKDPFNRGCYPWGEEDTEILAYYRTLAELRNGCPALKKGTVWVTDAGEGRLGFLRVLGDSKVFCCVNLSDRPWDILGSMLFAQGAENVKDNRCDLPKGAFGAFVV